MAYKTAEPAKPAQSARIGAKLTPRIANVDGAELWRDSPDYASDVARITYPLQRVCTSYPIEWPYSRLSRLPIFTAKLRSLSAKFC
jgi:hypothetical protein